MHLLGQRTLGILILILLGVLVFVKRRATGSVIELDQHTHLWVRLTNLFNLFFLLIVNPAVAILLISGQQDSANPTVAAISQPTLVAGLEIAGIMLYLLGFGLLVWALESLGEVYQLGGRPPRPSDELVQAGPYRYVRHPMYSAVLSIALGLALLTQSLAILILFCIYAALIVKLIPIEEEELRHAYPDRYSDYAKNAKRLIPYVF